MHAQNVTDLPLSEEFQLAAPKDYSLFHTLRFGRFGHLDPTQSLDAGHFIKALASAHGPSVVEGRLENSDLRIRVFGASRPEIRAQVTALLGVDTPPLAVQGHPVLERLSRHHRGIHLGHTLQLGYDLIKTVMQQLIEWRDAASIWRKWVLRTGTPVGGALGLVAPPTYHEIWKEPADTLHRCGLALRRVSIVREVARLGERLDQWAVDDPESVEKRIGKIPGVGPWTREHCLGFSLNLPDAVPVGDFQLPHTVAWALANEPRADDRRMLALLEPWRGKRWHVLRLLFAADIRAPRRGPRLNPGRPSKPTY